MAVAGADARERLLESRARLVKTADEERRRLERNLHDGAQQRLVERAAGVADAARAARRHRTLDAILDELGRRTRSCASSPAGCTRRRSPRAATRRSARSPRARRCRSSTTCRGALRRRARGRRLLRRGEALTERRQARRGERRARAARASTRRSCSRSPTTGAAAAAGGELRAECRGDPVAGLPAACTVRRRRARATWAAPVRTRGRRTRVALRYTRGGLRREHHPREPRLGQGRAGLGGARARRPTS